MRRVGVLMGGVETDPEMVARLSAFVQSLQHSGWIVGQNIGIEYRWARGNSDSIRKFAEELVALNMDVSGVKRTWLCAPHMSAFDPKRTYCPLQ
jgi:putative tryptophan/tyrosine transport system substrate-binding protein